MTFATPTLLLAAAAFLTPTESAPHATRDDFAFTSRGGIALTTSGDARYGIVDAAGDMPTFFSLSLGTAGENGAIVFTRLTPDAPLAGTYRIGEWGAAGTDSTAFHALFIAGTVVDPQGVFRGESGTITVRSTRPGEIEGTFTLKARGFLATDPEDENVRVTVHGTFTARGGVMVARVS